ncbi:hypothetical protein [Pseudomonas panipatensis]|uniref:Bacteriophage Rz lysis protein n=1 Tax=Pseudomonas panipatensis TaxID=428992 RepID=A0A1G8CU69_9PSED|nr:hypothetical protein [Pseudomonas panipatensis]SDH48804.1 hypothetical protein SAMN05216272_101764 [Pseudomonas panipatensis]SMP63569.1 hypothetical protein SAMN06295951_10678 [Pseudomonas panipatensis]
MQNTTYHLIMLGLAIAFGVALLIAWRTTRNSHAAGYSQGFEDGKRSQLAHINALHEDLALLRARHRLADAEHQLERERLIQDCDKRIAFYARRTSPFTEKDAVELMKISGQLQVTANTAQRIGATTHQAQALRAADSASQMAGRIRAVLAADDAQEDAA